MKSKVLIFGNGKSANIVANYIRAEFDDCMSFVGFYVLNYKSVNDKIDKNIYLLSQVTSGNFEIADTLVIPNPGKKISDILQAHRKIVNKRLLFVSAENIRHPNKKDYFVKIDPNAPWLSGFEYHVVDHCNLNCKGCGHCANLFDRPSYGNIDIFERDMKRLSELFMGVGLIRLLGGEPLLSSDLEQYINVTRKYYKYAEVHIVTNGILVLSKEKAFFQFLKEKGIIVDISVYPPIKTKIPLITKILKNNGIEYNIIPIKKFYKRFYLNGQFDKKKSFENCDTSTCHTLYNGKIASCIVPFSTDKLNRHFNLNIPVDGWIDLFEEGISGNKINIRLKQPLELCSHCNPKKSFFDWEQRCFGDCKLEDWICD